MHAKAGEVEEGGEEDGPLAAGGVGRGKGEGKEEEAEGTEPPRKEGSCERTDDVGREEGRRDGQGGVASPSPR